MMYILVVDGVDGECEIPGGCCTEPAFVAGIRAAVEKFCRTLDSSMCSTATLATKLIFR